MPHAPAQTVPELLTIDIEHPSASTAVCTVRGEIDLATETTFRTGLERAAGAAPMLVVDLGGVDYIGSIAATIIIDVLLRLSESQALKLVTGRSSAKVFEILGLGKVLDCFPNRWSI